MIELKEYQKKAVNELMEKTVELLNSGKSRNKLFFKAPTGAGKTVMASLCVQYELDSEWMAENILKAFHEQKVKNLDVDDSSLEKLINSALQKIK